MTLTNKSNCDETEIIQILNQLIKNNSYNGVVTTNQKFNQSQTTTLSKSLIEFAFGLKLNEINPHNLRKVRFIARNSPSRKNITQQLQQPQQLLCVQPNLNWITFGPKMDQTLTVRLIPTSRGNLLSLYARPWQQHTHTQKKDPRDTQVNQNREMALSCQTCPKMLHLVGHT